MTHPARLPMHTLPVTRLWRLIAATGLVALGLLAFTPGAAFAQQNDRERARSIVVEGQKNFKEGRFQEAAAMFLEAYQLDPHPVIMYNVARAYEEGGELINALQYYRLALQQRPSRAVRDELEHKIDEIGAFLTDQGVDITRLETAEWNPIGLMTVRTEPQGSEVSIDGVWVGVAPIENHKLSRGEHLVSITRRGFAPEERRLNVIPGKTYIISVEMQPEALADTRVKPGFLELRAPRRGLMVFIDGEPLATTPMGRLELRPGEHSISVEGADYPTWDTQVTIKSDETTRVAAANPTPTDIEQEDTSLLSQTSWGIVTMGAGVAVMGIGGVFGVLAQREATNYTDNRSEFGRATYRDNAQSYALTADIFYSLGLATVVTGGLIVLFDSDEEKAAPDNAYDDDLVQIEDLQLGPAVFEQGAGVSAQGRW